MGGLSSPREEPPGECRATQGEEKHQLKLSRPLHIHQNTDSAKTGSVKNRMTDHKVFIWNPWASNQNRELLVFQKKKITAYIKILKQLVKQELT